MTHAEKIRRAKARVYVYEQAVATAEGWGWPAIAERFRTDLVAARREVGGVGWSRARLER